MGRSRGIRSAVPAPAPTPSLESILRPRIWQGMAYRPLSASGAARALFSYAALWVPPDSPRELGWGAWIAGAGREAEGGAGDDAQEAEEPAEGHGRGASPGARAQITPGEAPARAKEQGEPAKGRGRGEAREPADKLVGALLLEPHGTVGMIYGPVVVNHPDPFEVASQLVAATLPHATALGIGSLFTRPQGLDRVWVRFGFIPVPERELPKVLRGRPGSGLFAWRGGSALWSSRKAGPDELGEVR